MSRLSRSAACASAGAAVVSRLFFGLMVESADASNGAWLSVGLGLLLALPVLRLALSARQAPLLRWALLPLMLLDAARALETAAFSESRLAVYPVAAAALLLPLGLAAARCVYLGGDAIGGAARIGLYAAAPLLGVVVAFQVPYFHPCWLTPLLGEGLYSLLRLALRSAGWTVAITGSAIALCDEPPRWDRVVRCLALACAAAALLIALRLMMAPAIVGGEAHRAIRVDTLLTNGRAPLYLQLPMIVIWFVGMLHLICYECFAASSLAGRCLPRLPRWACVLIGVVPPLALAAAMPVPFAPDYVYPILAAAALACAVYRRKGGAAWASE